MKNRAEFYITFPMLKVKEASQLLHMHSNTLRRWSKRGIIKAYRINHRGDRRFKLDDVISLLYQLQSNNGNENGVKIERSKCKVRKCETLWQAQNGEE